MAKIVIVDDDEDILRLYEHYLQSNNHEAKAFSDPNQSLDYLINNDFDLLITDILMPKLNGIELTKQLLKHKKHSKVLVCSEGGTSYAKEIVASIIMNKAIEFGALRALKKPFTKKNLIDTVDSILNEN